VTDQRAVPVIPVTLGRCDELRGEVLVRPGAGATITGTLSGPYRGRDTTLPVTARLQPTATAGLSRAILTEPAYWTPDLPNLYRLRATVATSGGATLAADRLVGLRRLGVRGRSLWFDGHRWVPRAVRVGDVAGIDACKPARLAALVTEPDEAVLARADEIGVAVLALVSAALAADAATLARRIAAWSVHPSAAAAILPHDLPAATVAEVADAALPHKDTLLLAATATGAAPPPATIPPGIDALVVMLGGDAVPHDAWRAGASAPAIAWRHAEASAALGRAPCDALQAALAAWASPGRDRLPWDWAGYAVG
jgi:hypothetical protein